LQKLKPSHDLEAFQAAFARHRTATRTALLSAQEIGYARADIAAVVQRLKARDFIKSMTSYNDHRQWQDVYVVKDRGKTIYLKFTDHVLTEFILLSFKRK
jgi:motility quorum-sensing regulator/GCU-specific mRNA interferase toxin